MIFLCFHPPRPTHIECFGRRCHVIQACLIKIEKILDIICFSYCKQSGLRNSNALCANITRFTTNIVTCNSMSSLEESFFNLRIILEKVSNPFLGCQEHLKTQYIFIIKKAPPCIDRIKPYEKSFFYLRKFYILHPLNSIFMHIILNCNPSTRLPKKILDMVL